MLKLKDFIKKNLEGKFVSYRKDVESIIENVSFIKFYWRKDMTDGSLKTPMNVGSNPPKKSECFPSTVKVVEEKKTTKIYGVEIPKILDNIKTRFTSEKKPEVITKWKQAPSMISLESINSRTTHIFGLVKGCLSTASRLKRLEELFDHLCRYPEAKPYAVKVGIVRHLLHLRLNIKDKATLQVIQQLFFTLGHIDPPNGPGVRILSIDGGGMRGIAVIKMLEVLQDLTGKPIYELFDYVCGVSTGAIITCCMVPPQSMAPSALYDLYRDLSSTVFSQSAFWGTGKLVWSHAYYDTNIWEDLLRKHVGFTQLLETSKFPLCPKLSAISSVLHKGKVSPFLFRNYSLPCEGHSEFVGSSRHTIFEAVRASSAAPTIFGEFKIGNTTHQDGGIVVNNPSAVAIHEVKTLWPDSPIWCLVSCGTGKYKVNPGSDADKPKSDSTSWKQIMDQILESATDTEAIHNVLNDLLPEHVYYRLNPYLTNMISMDEIQENRILELVRDTEMYCRRNEVKFEELAKRLVAPRTTSQKCRDYVNTHMKIQGLS